MESTGVRLLDQVVLLPVLLNDVHFLLDYGDQEPSDVQVVEVMPLTPILKTEMQCGICLETYKVIPGSPHVCKGVILICPSRKTCPNNEHCTHSKSHLRTSGCNHNPPGECPRCISKEDVRKVENGTVVGSKLYSLDGSGDEKFIGISSHRAYKCIGCGWGPCWFIGPFPTYDCPRTTPNDGVCGSAKWEVESLK